MSFSKAVGLGMICLVAFCAPRAMAGPITYYYTGPDFLDVAAPYTTSDSISGYFTLASPLGDNITLQITDYIPYTGPVPSLDFSFSDGQQTIDTGNAFEDIFTLDTNSIGQITHWDIDVGIFSNGAHYIHTQGFTAIQGFGYDSTSLAPGGADADTGTMQGTITDEAPTAPEPMSALLASTALLALAFAARKMNLRAQCRQTKTTSC
jgi:hypothetical protein